MTQGVPYPKVTTINKPLECHQGISIETKSAILTADEALEVNGMDGCCIYSLVQYDFDQLEKKKNKQIDKLKNKIDKKDLEINELKAKLKAIRKDFNNCKRGCYSYKTKEEYYDSIIQRSKAVRKK